MEKGKIRMLANLIELNKIELRLSKKYYGGISPKFYLRDLNKETLVEIPVAEICEDDICVKYYFKNVHIDLTHHYEMVDNYGLSAILQYVRLSELDDFDELFYYDGKLGPLYQKEKTTFKVWAPTALEVMVKVGNEAYQMERKEKMAVSSPMGYHPVENLRTGIDCSQRRVGKSTKQTEVSTEEREFRTHLYR